MDAVILAGGKGTRLKPYTVSIPKPLVPLGEEPIIEILLRQLAEQGIRRAHITMGHLSGLMKAYFDEVKARHDLEILYSFETKPLGTIGPVKLLSDVSDPYLLLNGDILTTLSFQDLVEFHRREGCIATVAIHRRQVPIEYGVIEVDGDSSRIVGHREKPTLDVDVGMGIYVFERRIDDYIPEGQKFDVPELLHALMAAGESVAAFRSGDYWMDIGRPDDYARAFEDFSSEPDRFFAPGREPESRRDAKQAET